MSRGFDLTLLIVALFGSIAVSPALGKCPQATVLISGRVEDAQGAGIAQVRVYPFFDNEKRISSRSMWADGQDGDALITADDGGFKGELYYDTYSGMVFGRHNCDYIPELIDLFVLANHFYSIRERFYLSKLTRLEVDDVTEYKLPTVVVEPIK